MSQIREFFTKCGKKIKDFFAKMTVEVNEKEDKEGWSLGDLLATVLRTMKLLWDVLLAVSYTHLDVYKRQVRDTAYGYQIWVGIPTSYTVRTALFSFTWMISVALILVLVLYLLLQRIFRNYQKQVLDLVDTMEAISQGDSERRINVDTKEQELLLVAEMTNTMLDNMDKSIRDIYQLQLSQKDANMKALQAQINPHFMYNTMEFIRMYAVMQDQEELADIIYEFSSLLRKMCIRDRLYTS